MSWTGLDWNGLLLNAIDYQTVCLTGFDYH